MRRGIGMRRNIESRTVRHARWLGLLVSLYPRAFRDRFGAEMIAAFEQEITSAQTRGRVALARWWGTTLAASLGCALVEHRQGIMRHPARRRHRLPLVAGASGKGDHWMQNMIADLRHAGRRMTKSPGFTAIAVLTIGLGIGVNAAVFSLIDTILLRPLPFADSDRLVRVWSAQPDGNRRFLETTIDELNVLREHHRAFVEIAAVSLAPRDLHDSAGTPRGVVVARVSRGFFDVIGVSPSLGRGILDEEYTRGAPVVVLSHNLWQTRYGGHREVVGETLSIQGELHQVVGIMPRALRYPQEAMLWRPFTEDENQDDDRELQVVARLRPDVTVEQASAEVASILSHSPPADPDSERMTGWVQPLQAMMVKDIRRPFWLLLAAVVAVLAIACANVANLQLVQGAARSRELAIRTALGAGRRRMMTQVLTESVAVAACGGLLGLGLGSWLLQLMVLISPADLPRLAEVRLDLRVAAVMLAVTMVSGILFGLFPALRAARFDPASALHGSRATLGRQGQQLQQLFAIAQIAMATLLVVSAGLLTATFVHIQGADRGFTTDHVLTVDLSPPNHRDTHEQRVAFYQQVRATLADLPGVEAAALTNFHPMQDYGFRMPFEIVGQPVQEGGKSPQALLRSTSAEFFRAAGIQLVAGADFPPDAAQAGAAQGLTIVNEAFVQTFLPAMDPLRQRLTHPAYFGDEQPVEHQIIGVVADVRADAAAGPVKPRIYLPYRQMPWPRMKALIRFSDAATPTAASIREQIWALDPTIPVDVTTMEQWIATSVASQRFNMRMMGAFAGLALLLAALGIYGVLSSHVARRTREIGLRVTLGASWRSIVAMVLDRGLRLSLAGVALGLVGAWWATRWLASLLFGIRPLEPWLLLGVALGFVAVALAASAFPALRALRVDPLSALRAD